MKSNHPPGPAMLLRKEFLEPAFHKCVDPFRIVKGKGFRLKNFDPGDTRGLSLDKGLQALAGGAGARPFWEGSRAASTTVHGGGKQRGFTSADTRRPRSTAPDGARRKRSGLARRSFDKCFSIR